MSLNVFKQNYCPWRYPSNWIQNARLFCRQFKWAYQRVTKGFCDCDWWDLDTYLSQLLADSIETLANKSISYPGNEEFDTPEKWEAYLREIVKKLRYSLNDSLYNEYEEEYVKSLEKRDLLKDINKQNTPEELELFTKFFNVEMKNENLKRQAQDDALDMIKHVYNNLWD